MDYFYGAFFVVFLVWSAFYCMKKNSVNFLLCSTKERNSRVDKNGAFLNDSFTAPAHVVGFVKK